MAIILPSETLAKDIIYEVGIEGVVGIHGGRPSVKEKVAQVKSIKSSNIKVKDALNHPYGAIAIIYDEDQYNEKESEKKIIDKYDRLADK